MAYQNLATGVAWGSGYTALSLSFAYDSRRTGADMQYKLRLTVDAFDTGHYFGYPIYATIKLDGSEQVTGATVKGANPSSWASPIVYETGWLTVADRPTGSVVATFQVYSGSGSNRTETYAYSLPVIQAASILTVSSGTLGVEQVLTVTRYDSGFTHTITAACGTASVTVASKSAALSIKFTPPIEWASQAPNGPTVAVKYTIDTYGGSTKLGSNTVTVSCKIPDSVVPTVSMAVSDPTGNKDHYGAFIQSQSKAKVDLTAKGAYGSTITAYQIIVGGSESTTNGATFDLPDSGKVAVTCKVTDSRGRSATVTAELSVTAYKPPTVSVATHYRCDAEGNEVPDGAYAYVEVAAEIASVAGMNTAALSVAYRVKGSTSWTTTALAETTSAVIPASPQKAYEIKAICVDDFLTRESVIRVLGIAYVDWQWDPVTHAISIGQLAVDPNTFAVAVAALFKGTVTIEQSPTSDTDAVNKGYIESRIQCGWFDPGEIAANGWQDYTLTFPKPFPKTPRVLVSVYSNTTSQGYTKLAVVVQQQMAAGFVLRFISGYDYALHPTINWIAMIED